MKKELIKQELLRLTDEAKELQEKSELQTKTANFFLMESDKLLEKSKDESLTFNQQEKLSKQIIALGKRIKHEVNMFDLNEPKLKAIENRLEEIIKICETQQLEG